MDHGELQGGGEYPHYKLDDHLRDSFVSIKHYGAVEGGTKDCSQAFQDALDDTRRVYIPPGTWLFETPGVVSNSGQHIACAGQELTTLKSSAGIISASGAVDYLSFYGATILPTSTSVNATTTQHYLDAVALDLTGVSYSKVDSVRVWQHATALKLDTTATTNAYYNDISRVYAWDCLHGAWLGGTSSPRDGANANVLTACTFKACWIGVYCQGSGNTFQGVRMESLSGTGYPVAPYGYYFDDPYALGNSVLGGYVELPADGSPLHFGGSNSWDNGNHVEGGFWSKGGAASAPTGPALGYNSWNAHGLTNTRQVIYSPDGTRYAFTVANDGTLTSTAL